MKKKIVGLAHGVFDVLHSGHLLFFKECKAHCDELIVSITDDKFVNKGPDRPIFDSNERLELIKSFKFIDKVFINKDFTPIKLIQKLKPNYYFKGKDYSNFSNDLSGNIYKEKKFVEKHGGKILILNTKQTSSSKIINSNFNFLSEELKKTLNSIDKKSIINFFKTNNNYKSKKKILIFGEAIVDKYTYVDILGKSQKNQIISTHEVSKKSLGGGTILVSLFLTNFFKKIDYLGIDNDINRKCYNRFFNRNIKKILVKDNKSKITIKNRFINKDKGERLFQNNLNNDQRLSKSSEIKLLNKFKKIIHKYDKIILFDFGHGLVSREIINFINKNKKKFYINCQSNSSNFGFNLATKFQGGHTICIDEMEFRLCVSDKTSSIDYLIDKNLKFINKFKYFIITRGKEGCFYIHQKKKHFVPAIFKLTGDTTGAGDIFFSTIIFLSVMSNLGMKEKVLLSHITAGIHRSENASFKEINFNIINKIFSNLIK
jgi:rfaE bifunctional protein nucleotidyltransferase chain/domain